MNKPPSGTAKQIFDLIKKPAILGILLGLTYGITSRFLIYNEKISGLIFITSFGFVFLVPFVMGYLTVQARKKPFNNKFKKASFIIFMPWIPTFLGLLAALITGLEAVACVIMAAPIFLIMSSIGGITAEITRSINNNKIQKSILAGLLFLPYSTSALENVIPNKSSLQEVHSEITIAAEAGVVWNNIRQVPMIQENEQEATFFHKIGFPRPLEATLSHDGVGGIRHASFEDNVLFVETITDWQPQKQLAFTIEANAEESTSAFLNGKILGGYYFDVLDGTYRIEPLPEGGIKLHLDSRHRVSTHYNIYAGFWTRWIMSDLQMHILKVIKQRCEAQ